MYLFDFIVYLWGWKQQSLLPLGLHWSDLWCLDCQEMVKAVPPWQACLLRHTCWLTRDGPTLCWQSEWKRNKSYDLCLCDLSSPLEESRGSAICLWSHSSRYQLLTMLEAISNKQHRGVSAFMEIVLRWITSFYSSCLLQIPPPPPSSLNYFLLNQWRIEQN